MMKDFDALQAKQIVDSMYNDELHKILVDIKAEAEKGETVLHVSKPLKGKTVDALRDRGFSVARHSAIATQREELYYTINWG